MPIQKNARRLKFTAKEIARLPAPDPSGKQTPWWDTELRSFGVMCSGVSNSKTFFVQRDLPDGRTRKVTIGPVNVFSLERARQEAQVVLADLYRGIDPKKSRRGDATLRGTLDAYLAARKDLRSGTTADYRSSLALHLPQWLDRPLRDITPEEVEAEHRSIQRRIAANGRHDGGATANRVMRAFRALWNFAADRDPSLPSNPVRRLKKAWYPTRRRERMVPERRLPEFCQAVRDLPNPIHRDYILTLLFTGLRREEAASLRWSDVDFDARTIRLPAERMKAGKKLDLPMSDFVEALLRERRKIGDTDFVFPSDSQSGHIAEPKFPFGQIKKATGIAVSAHDLRRNFITAAESADISPLALKALVAHSLGNDVTSGYVQMTVERLREPAQKVTDRLKNLCGLASKTAAGSAH